MEIKEIIKEPINKIWKKHEEFSNVPPLSVSEVPENAIIFVGINPSLGENDREVLSKEGNREIEFYDNPANNTGKPHPYFKKFETISKEVGLPWGHIDLLYIRETQQNKINDLIKDDKGRQFIFEQSQVTRNVIDAIIEKSNPKVFVVNNTLARGLLGRYKTKQGVFPDDIPLENVHWINYMFEWNEEYGTYFLEGTKLPFFFSSMLTGQRALDNSSFERLIWHIKFVLNKLDN